MLYIVQSKLNEQLSNNYEHGHTFQAICVWQLKHRREDQPTNIWNNQLHYQLDADGHTRLVLEFNGREPFAIWLTGHTSYIAQMCVLLRANTHTHSPWFGFQRLQTLKFRERERVLQTTTTNYEWLNINSAKWCVVHTVLELLEPLVLLMTIWVVKELWWLNSVFNKHNDDQLPF